MVCAIATIVAVYGSYYSETLAIQACVYPHMTDTHEMVAKWLGNRSAVITCPPNPATTLSTILWMLFGLVMIRYLDELCPALQGYCRFPQVLPVFERFGLFALHWT